MTINKAEYINPVRNSGEIKFQAYIEGYACSIRIPIQTGHEPEAWAYFQDKLRKE